MNCIIDAWNSHEAELRGYLNRQLKDGLLAEDLLQDTFLKALGEGAEFCQLENPRAWLFRVARNGLVDYYRRHKPLLELDSTIPEQNPEIAAVETLSACLPVALLELTAEDQEAIRLCDLDGLNQQEYAQRKGISLPGAKSRVQRARKRLKKQLKITCQVQFDDAGNVCCFQPCNEDSHIN